MTIDFIVELLGADADWMNDAACQGMPPSMFYPDFGSHADEPIAVCWACPVRSDCLDYALTNGEKFGIWGGLSERERKKLRGRRRRAAA